MKEKYITEHYPRYFVFGKHLTDGRVDVASSQLDTIATVSEADAKRLIEDRDRVIDLLIATIQAFDHAAPDALSEFWYNTYKHGVY